MFSHTFRKAGEKEMEMNDIIVTYIGGATALIEIDNLKFLTDPTFDPAGTEYSTRIYTLKRTMDPALSRNSLGYIDAVLLSHDHHFDNLDNAGRSMLPSAGAVLTTKAGAERLGGNAVGLAPWEEFELTTQNDEIIRITATPARHGPTDGDRGPVTGFIVEASDALDKTLYISGDTVWYEGFAEIAQRFRVTTAILFMGAAKVREVGPAHLTLTADEGVQFAKAFPDAEIIPLHYEGWKHFSETREDIERVFKKAKLSQRLRWLEPGMPTKLH